MTSQQVPDAVRVNAVTWISEGEDCSYNSPNMVLLVTEGEQLLTRRIVVSKEYAKTSMSRMGDEGCTIDKLSALSGVSPPMLYDLWARGKRVGVSLVPVDEILPWVSAMADVQRHEMEWCDHSPRIELIGMDDREDLLAEDLLNEQLVEYTGGSDLEESDDREDEDDDHDNDDSSESEEDEEDDVTQPDDALSGMTGVIMAVN